MVKQCSNKYGFGCKNKIEYEDDKDLDQMFYRKDGYSQNICKECISKYHAKKYVDGKYNYRSKSNRTVDKETYGTFNQ